MASPQRSEFVVPLHDLRRRSHNRRDVKISTVMESVAVADTMIDARHPVLVDLTIEAAADGVSATGVIEGRWHGACSLCLDDVGGALRADVTEVFKERPLDEDSYPLGSDHIDLEPMVRDALILELPLLARCPNGGIGICDRVPEVLQASLLTDEAGESGSTDGGHDPTEGHGSESGPELADPRWAALSGLTFDDPDDA
jgi:uncharacterized protein